MLKDIAYTLVLGKPVVLWLGLTTMAFLLSAIAVVGINRYTKARILFEWHVRLALTGILIGIVHFVLAISLYLNI